MHRTAFSKQDHFPLFAGHALNDEPLYFAYLQQTGPHVLHLAVPDGACPEKLRVRFHFMDGSIKETVFRPGRVTLAVHVLRYDPDAYSRSKHYPPKAGISDEMDATGPFSWKFHRRLPDTQSKVESSLDEMITAHAEPRRCRSDAVRRLRWVETVVEPHEEDIL